MWYITSRQDQAPLKRRLFSRSADWSAMIKFNKFRYALSGVWKAAPKISTAYEETDTSKLRILKKQMEHREIPKFTVTPDLWATKRIDVYITC